MDIPNIGMLACNLLEKEPGYIHGRIDLGTTALHVEMIQVKDGEGDDSPSQVTCGSEVNEERYKNLLGVHAGDGRGFETITWDGRCWIIHIFPYAR